MKFPTSMHADGWANHIDTTAAPRRSNPLGPAGTRRRVGVKISSTAPLHDGASTASTPRLNAMGELSVAPRTDSSPAAARQAAAVLPPEEQRQQIRWALSAVAGAIVIAGLGVWAVNRSHLAPVTPPAPVIGSTEPATQLAAATPEPTPATDRDDGSAATPAAAAPEPAPAAEPARLGPPVTTAKPAVEPRPTVVAQADVPAPRPDLVLRANPRDAGPAPTPYLQPAAPVDALPQGNAQINVPPTAAGPVAAVTPQAASVPDTAAPVATAPVMPPAADDSGITQKVRSALLADAALAAVPITVSTDHGVVRLEGQAPDAPTRERATVVASSATGVKAVDNRLTLPPAAVVSQAPSNNL